MIQHNIRNRRSLFGSGGYFFIIHCAGTKTQHEYVQQQRTLRGEVQDAKAEMPAEMKKTASTGETDSEVVTKKLRESISDIRDMEAVSRVTGNEVPKSGRPTERAMEFLKTIGNKVTRKGFGDVLFSKSGVKSGLLGHGISDAKIDTFAAVPSVIQNGRQIDYQQNRKGRTWDSYVFAAPVEYKGKTIYLAAVVAKDKTSNRYYLHQVVNENGEVIFETEEAPNTEPDGTSALSGDLDTVSAFGASDNSISQAAENSQETSAYKALQLPPVPVEEQAKPMTVEELRWKTPEEAVREKYGTREDAQAARQADIDETFSGETLAEETARREAENRILEYIVLNNLNLKRAKNALRRSGGHFCYFLIFQSAGLT